MNKLKPVLPLAEKLEITHVGAKQCTLGHNFDDELMCILAQLPERFNDRKISIIT